MPGSSSSTLVGQLVFERYQVEAIVGRGGQGIVYRALDLRSNQSVALKVLNDEASHDSQAAGRFLREQLALKALAGTAAVEVFDAGETADGNLFLALELLDGHDLEHELERLETESQRMPTARIAQLMAPVSATLDAAHARGILHRDLKPANLFLLRGGGVRLLDFGFARLRASQPLTATGMIMGSPSYIAPEVWNGRLERVDHRVDVYALGVILFRLFSGELPFWSKDVLALLRMATGAPRPALSKFRPELPRAADDWAAQALAIEAEHRFQSAGQCLEQLFAALGAAPVLAAARSALLQQTGATAARTPPAQLPGLPGPAAHAGEAPDSEPPVAQRGATLSKYS